MKASLHKRNILNLKKQYNEKIMMCLDTYDEREELLKLMREILRNISK